MPKRIYECARCRITIDDEAMWHLGIHVVEKRLCRGRMPKAKLASQLVSQSHVQAPTGLLQWKSPKYILVFERHERPGLGDCVFKR